MVSVSGGSFELRGNGGGDGFHLLLGERELGSAEIHVGTLIHRHEVDMGVGHVEADDRHTYFGAGDGFLIALATRFAKSIRPV